MLNKQILKQLSFFPQKLELNNWSNWWRELSTKNKLWPVALIFLILLSFGAVNGIRNDHINVCILILVLGYGGRVFRSILVFLTPAALMGMIYDSQRYYSDYIRGRIRVEEPYLFDKYFFGIQTQNGVLTPNEWLQLNTHWILDLYTGFFYLTFIGIFISLCAYIYFYKTKTGTDKFTADELKPRVPQMMWAFFWVNIIGYTTYYWYPAAPPWYVEIYGLGPADLSAQANAAGCLRFDELLGTNFFTQMYGRSADVFGAIPSLHVAYPFQSVYYAYRFGTGRVFSVVFFLSMCFAAVYLNHHYILDIIWGVAYALIINAFIDWWYERKIKKEALSN